MSEQDAIFVSGLEFEIEKKQILKDLSFTVKKGSVFAIVGHNGAGKTTLFHIMLGLKFQNRGEIQILGGSSLSWKSRAKVGYVLERPYLNLEHHFRSFLRYHAKLAGVSSTDSELERVAAQVGLGGNLDQYLNTFSKGMLQKALLAQASLGNPEILILDEPMSGLDPSSREAVKTQIQHWREMGKTVIFSSHVLEDVEQLANEVLILTEGEVKFFGSVEDWKAAR